MTGLVSNGGLDDFLKASLNIAAAENLDLCLFKNNHTPSAADVAADYTVATFTGYATKLLVAATWALSGTRPRLATYPIQTFTSSADQAAQTIYGWFIKGRTSGRLKAAELFPIPQLIQFNADYITVIPVLGDT